MAIGRTVLGPKVPTLKGTEASLSSVQCFLYLEFYSIHVSVFHITFWTDYIYICSICVVYIIYRHLTAARYIPGWSLGFRGPISATSSLLTLAFPLLRIANFCPRPFSVSWFPQKH